MDAPDLNTHYIVRERENVYRMMWLIDEQDGRYQFHLSPLVTDEGNPLFLKFDKTPEKTQFIDVEQWEDGLLPCPIVSQITITPNAPLWMGDVSDGSA